MKTMKYLAVLTVATAFSLTAGYCSDASSKDIQIVNKKSVSSETSDTKKTASKTDSEISKAVITEIVREDTELAAQTKRLKILTVNGHVTISGKTRNEKQKQTIGTVAARVVGADNVENKLEVR